MYLSPYASRTDVLTTELNSLANNANSAASTAIDNSVSRYPWADVVVNIATQGSARSSGATVLLYMCPRTDGANFDDTSDVTAELVAAFTLDATTTARRVTRRKISLVPEQAKFFLRNATGQALAASGNTLSLIPYYDIVNDKC